MVKHILGLGQAGLPGTSQWFKNQDSVKLRAQYRQQDFLMTRPTAQPHRIQTQDWGLTGAGAGATTSVF